MNMQDIGAVFADAEAGLVWLARHGLIKNTMTCPRAVAPATGQHANQPVNSPRTFMTLLSTRNKKMHNAMSNARGQATGTDKRWSWSDPLQWRCPACFRPTDPQIRPQHIHRSVRDGSFFENAKVPLESIIKMAYIFSHYPRMKIDQVKRESGVQSPTTIVDWMNFFREVCAVWAVENAADRALGGPGRVVEIDETKLFRAKHHRGHQLLIDRDRTWVFGMYERGTRRVVVVSVRDRTAATLLPIIQQWVRPGSIIYSDMWAAYGGINRLQQNFQHQWVNHRLNFVDPQDRRVHTNGIEGQWNLLKRDLRHLHGISENLFESYLFRFMFYRAHSTGPDGGTEIFNALLKEIRRQYPFA